MHKQKSILQAASCQLQAMKRQYISAMFDIDGTLTEMGSQEIPLPLAQKLADLSLKMPLAFATGRNLNHLEGKLDQIISRSKTQKDHASTGTSHAKTAQQASFTTQKPKPTKNFTE